MTIYGQCIMRTKNSGCSDGGRALPGTSRCRNHTRSNWGSYRPAHTAVYRTPEWRTLRDRVVAEEPTCYVDGCTNPSSEADHIEPAHKREDLALVRSNVRGICRDHHRTRSSKQGGEAKAKKGR